MGVKTREKEVEELETDAKGAEARNKSAVKPWTHTSRILEITFVTSD